MTATLEAAAEVAIPKLGRRKLWTLIALLTGMSLAALDQTVFGTALPTIVGELHGVQHQAWVTTAYLLTSLIVLPAYGTLGNRVGHKPMFMIAISLFIVGSAVGGFATNMMGLIVGRAIQGLGGGGLMIVVQAIITNIMTMKQRAKYSWIFGIVFGGSTIIGPLIGGWLTGGPGWRWVLWINVPFGIVALAMALALVPQIARPAIRPKLDYIGIGLLGLTSTAVILATSWGGVMYPWGSWRIIALFTAAVVCALAFIFVERKVSDPVMPGFLFKDRNFVLVTIAFLALGIVMMGTFAYLPTYLQMVTGKSAISAGYLMLPMVVTMLITSTLVGRIATAEKRTKWLPMLGHYKWSPITGMVIVAFALVLMSRMTPHVTDWDIRIYTAVMGLGIGMCMSILMLIIQNQFSLDQVGPAIATNGYFRQIGMLLGASIVGTLFVSKLTDLLNGRLPGISVGTEGQGSFTPAVVQSLPSNVKDAVISSYNDALTPVFLGIVPLALAVFLMLFFVKEKPLDEAARQQMPIE